MNGRSVGETVAGAEIAAPSLEAYECANIVRRREPHGATLVTLDRRLAGAPGPRCAVAVPPVRRRR